MEKKYHYLKIKINESLNNESEKQARIKALEYIRDKHLNSNIDAEKLKKEYIKIKERNIANLDNLLPKTINQLKANGCKVYLASDKEEALKFLKRLLEGNIIVKSKLNTGKEIELSKNLEKWGYNVVETDLGDRIVQLSKSTSSHPLIPALHIPKKAIANLFGAKGTISTKKLINLAKEQLKELILQSKVGISGANAITAEEGFICLVENEGNQRLVTSLPKKHIVIAGIDKIIKNGEEAIKIIKAASYFGLGVISGNYISFIMGPSRTGDIAFEIVEGMHGPSEVHVILLDNQRKKIIPTEFKEILYCVNCGGCVNYCPVYEVIGRSFGSGGGGKRLIFDGLANGLEYAFTSGMNFCTECGICVNNCPGEINLAELMIKIREEAYKQGLAIPKHKEVLNSINEYNNPFNEKIPRDNWLKGRNIKITHESKTLFFVGCMSSYRIKDQAISAAKLLNKLNIKFDYLGEEELCCSGFLKRIGFIDEFNENRQELEKKLKKYKQIITICPGCYSAFREFYSNFLKSNNIEVKHLVELINLKSLKESLKVQKKQISTTYHDPCHISRKFDLYDPPRKILDQISYYKEMVFSKENSHCCGAGGGCLSAFPKLSKTIAERRIMEASDLGYDYLTSSCPFCEYNLKKGINADKQLKIISIQQLLLNAL